jgi:hypothetical protein
MRNNVHNVRHLVFFLAAVTSLLLAACGSGNADATPTLSVDAIYTSAFYTLEAQQATIIAMTPSATSTPLPSPTVPTPTVATLLAAGNGTTSASGAQGCDNSVYVNDVTIPDGTVLSPGKNFVKTWTLMNNGTCAWGAGYKLVFITGEAMGGSSVPLTGSVPAGQQSPLSVSLIAPANSGDYTGWWRLQNPAGQYFGTSVSVVIKVGSGGGSASTNTPGGASASATAPAATNTP